MTALENAPTAPAGPVSSGPPGWVVGVAVAGTVFIALGAFWLSFASLTELAQRAGIPVDRAWVWPLIVDGVIVVATVSVVALSGQRGGTQRRRRAAYPWALLIGGAVVSVAANASRAVVDADAAVPSVLAAAVAAVPPVVLVAITHLTVVLTDRRSAGPTPRAGQMALAGAVVRGELPMPADRRDKNDGGARRNARGEALRLRAETPWTNRQIAARLGVHPSTVGRWLQSDHPQQRQADTATAAQSERNEPENGEDEHGNTEQ